MLGFMSRAVVQQLALPFARGRGGARRGAGRKRLPLHARHTPHRVRPLHRPAHPVHVTLRASVRSLRAREVAPTVLLALRDSNGTQFRVAHYSIQENHLHLIVEADSGATLSSGMRGLMVRLARRVNRLLFRRGRFWADRWHGVPLKTPRQVRHALVYVLQNRQKHAESSTPPRGSPERRVHLNERRVHLIERTILDPLSSAQWFKGFVEPLPLGFRAVGPPCVATPRTWLLRAGWQRRGLIHQSEVPR
jgi:putative transposase